MIKIIKIILLFSFIIYLIYLIKDSYINKYKENLVNLNFKKRCLITDILFPTKFSKWRLVEIFS